MEPSLLTPKAVFDHAHELRSPEERRAYLDQACADAPELRAQVEALLGAYDAAGSFLEPPPRPDGTGEYRPPEGPGSRIGPYKLLQEIGEGGMGVVFMAEQEKPVRRRIALKIIKPGMDSAHVVARFEAERQALAMMDHQNIARVLDAGTTDSGRPYFVMELVHGIPITKYCDEHHLSPRERLELFIPVCQAIQHAHQKGVIHRDIKPSNIMVCLYDGKPVPKVIDFGVAKATEQRLTERTMFTNYGTIIGTFEYMAPEQAEMSQLGVDTRSDIYSLGVLLYELLTGSTPLERKRVRAAALDEVLRLIREEEPPKPSTRVTQSKESLASSAAQRKTEPAKLSRLMRGELDWIVMKALEKDRTRRYETANGLARDVQRFLADEPVEACPPSARYKVRKFARKYRAGLVTAAAFVVLLLAGVVASTWQALRATRAQAAAQAEEQKAKESADEAKAVLAFFQDKVLAAGRPEGEDGGLGKDVTLRKAIDAAKAEMGPAFKNRPVIEASILRVLAETYWYLGEREPIMPMYERVLELRTTHLGPEHPDTLQSMLDLASNYGALGQFDRSFALFERTLQLRKAQLGSDHPDTLTTMDMYAETYRIHGRLAEALALHEETLSRRQKKFGPDHLDTLQSVGNLALTYLDAGRGPEALKLLEPLLARLQKQLGSTHPNTLKTLNDLAIAYEVTGRKEEVLRMYEQALALHLAKYGPDHPKTFPVAHNVATTYQAGGRLAEALRLMEDYYQRAKAKLGADDYNTLHLRNGLASIYGDMGRAEDALRLFRENYELSRGKLGPENALTLQFGESLAQNYNLRGDLDQAERLWLELLSPARKAFGPDSIEVSNKLLMLGVTYLKKEKFAEAEPLLRECLAIRAKKLPDDWRHFLSQNLLGGSLLGQKRYAEAEPLLVGGYEGMKQREAKVDTFNKGRDRVIEAVGRLVQFYEETGKPDEAAKWRKELEAVKLKFATTPKSLESPSK